MRNRHLLPLALVIAQALTACSRRMPASPGPRPPPAGETFFSPFVSVSPDRIPELIEELAGPGSEAARDLITRTTPECFPLFDRILREGDETQAALLLDVLADHLNAEAFRLIRDLALTGRGSRRRLRAMAVLEELAPTTGVDFLRPLGKLLGPDTDPPLRRAALAVLKVQPVPPLARRLVGLLSDTDNGIRLDAAEALRILVVRHDRSARELARDIDMVEPESARLELARIIGAAGPRASQRTVHLLLESENREVRRQALAVMRETGLPEDRPPALYARILDDDDGVFYDVLALLNESGGRKDAAELAKLLSDPRLGPARREALAGLLDRLAGTAFGPDEEQFRRWARRWTGSTLDGPAQSASAETVTVRAVGLSDDGAPFPWTLMLAAAFVLAFAAAGFHLAGRSGADEAREEKEIAEPPSEEREIPPSNTPIGKVGKWIFDNRILVLLPWFIPPLLLFEAARLPALPYRLVFYGLLALGVFLRVWCTGYRTWAYRSGGERHLMTAGPYSVARHPIYAANFLLALPLFLAVNLWPLTAAFSLWFILTHLAIIVREDEVLKERYGEEWSTYAAEVRRILPRLTLYARRRGDFSWEPIVKGMELFKAAVILILPPLALEIAAPWWNHAAAALRALLGF